MRRLQQEIDLAQLIHKHFGAWLFNGDTTTSDRRAGARRVLTCIADQKADGKHTWAQLFRAAYGEAL